MIPVLSRDLGDGPGENRESACRFPDDYPRKTRAAGKPCFAIDPEDLKARELQLDSPRPAGSEKATLAEMRPSGTAPSR